MKRILFSVIMVCFGVNAFCQSIYDINGDNKVNILDVTELSSKVNSRDSKYDLNGDGVIDNQDAAFVVDSLLKRNDAHVITSMLVIHMKDSTWSAVILNERPVFSFTDSLMNIKVSNNVISLPLDKIAIANFEEKLSISKSEAVAFIRKNKRISKIYIV